MTPEMWAEIRRLAKIEQLSISEIARRMRLDRKTVRAALASEAGPPAKPSSKPRPSRLDLHKPFIQKRLKEFPRISAVRLLRELRPLGYPGGITILKDYLATLRPRIQEAFFRIETQPGEQAQVDWANCGSIVIGNARRKLSLFVMVLSWSRMMYAEFSLSQCLEDFLACHWRAFQFFGGIPKKCLYDNLKSVVLTRYGADIRFNPRFMEFSGACLFEPVLCRPARGNEKGKVESGIKYCRSSFLDGRSETLWSQIQLDLSDWIKGTANLRIHGTIRARPVDRFELERPLLQALPSHEPDTCIVQPGKASSQHLVKFDGNAYTIPHQYSGKTVTVKATRTDVRIFLDAQLLASHGRSFERGLVIENPAHYEGLLATKRAAHAAKTTDQFLALAGPSQEAKTALEAYLHGLVQSELHVFHHLQKILELSTLYGRTEVLQAITQAIPFKAFGVPYLQNLITQNRSARGQNQSLPVVIPSKPDWTRHTVEQQDLALYDDLFDDTPRKDSL